jgi:hypothetical protein
MADRPLAIIGRVVGEAGPERAASLPVERWAAFLGTFLATASLGLVLLADFGWFRTWLALVVVAGAAIVAAAVWRPSIRVRWAAPSTNALLASAVLFVGAALIAPGSENIAGSRDQAVYVATGFAIARGGSTIIHDPTLRLLAQTEDPARVESWLYRNAINGALIRFPGQLFVRDLTEGSVEGGFLPLFPAWIALASSLGGIELSLHVAGLFGVLTLAFVMLASRVALYARAEGGSPLWLMAGAILAVSFSQVWWAREPMAEAALGAFTWLVAWATVRWRDEGEWRWATLAGLAAVCGLFTRVDGVLPAAALGLIALRDPGAGRRLLLTILAVGLIAAGAHDALRAPVYTSITYGPFTLTRAAAGLAALVVVLTALTVPRLPWPQALAAHVQMIRRAAVLLLLCAAAAISVGALSVGAERPANQGAATPLAWLPGYIPWPILALAALGIAWWGWRGVPRGMMPLVLIGGLSAALYLPNPLVTGDHPWMVRRLVPAVIPLIAIAATVGVRVLWQDGLRWPRSAAAGRIVASGLIGLGLGLSAAQDGDLVTPRNGSGVLEGLAALAADLPPNAVVFFPGGEAGIHLAMPLDSVLGVDAFVVPFRAADPERAATLARFDRAGRAVYWAEDGGRPPLLAESLVATAAGAGRIRYLTADNGPTPPPLQLREIDHRLTIYRLTREEVPNTPG